MMSILLSVVIVMTPLAGTKAYAYEQDKEVVEYTLDSEEEALVENVSVTNGTTPQAESENSELNSVGGFIQVNEITKNGNQINITADAEKTVNEQTLDVTIRGLTDNNYDGTMELIDEYLDSVVQTGEPLSMRSSDYIDAEKFNLDQNGYDQQHCWIATASNMLWSTGYAQKAINPSTGEAFSSVDEVMSYFSDNFTDNVGDPEAAVSWFFKGEYEYQGASGVAQLKQSGTGGLLPDENYEGAFRFTTKENSNAISTIESIASCGIGVLVRWFDGKDLSIGAHWMTVMGAVVNQVSETITNFSDRYKGILIANSDDSPVNGSIENTTSEQKLEAKMGQTNRYILYRLTYDDEYRWWTIDGFSDKKPTVITAMYYLVDSDKHLEGDGVSDPEIAERRNELRNSDLKEFIQMIDPNNEHYVKVEKIEDVNAKDVAKLIEDEIAGDESANVQVILKQNEETIPAFDVFETYTTKQLEDSENIFKLHERMIRNNVQVFSLKKGIVEAGVEEKYDAYISAASTDVVKVQIDGVTIADDQYHTRVLGNGFIKFVIHSSYMKDLEQGKHKVCVYMNGEEVPVEFEIEVQ